MREVEVLHSFAVSYLSEISPACYFTLSQYLFFSSSPLYYYLLALNLCLWSLIGEEVFASSGPMTCGSVLSSPHLLILICYKSQPFSLLTSQISWLGIFHLKVWFPHAHANDSFSSCMCGTPLLHFSLGLIQAKFFGLSNWMKIFCFRSVRYLIFICLRYRCA